MAGQPPPKSTPRYNAICAALIGELRAVLRGGECRVFTSDQRVSVAFERRYVYPDATVVCGPVELEPGTRDVVTNPRVVVEVVSAGSEANDRGSKGPGERITVSGAALDVDRIYEGVFELPGDEAQPVGEPF